MASPTRALALFILIAAPMSLRAQQWVTGGALPLVRDASAARRDQATDTALASWSAKATGLIRLGAIAEPGSVTGPVPDKADRLAVTVYGRLPDRIKQVITEWSDSILVSSAGTTRYHRDHLGIVASDFGDRIRLGDGEEVRNLIHPLSADGLRYYEFMTGDTVQIRPGRDVVPVVAVSVRPRDPHSPGTIGTLYIDPDRRALVRFRFTFTPESYLDPRVRDITVTLESALLYSAYWLPSRQSIVVRRTTFNGTFRADWEIHDYVIGQPIADSLFRQGRDSLPSVGGLRAPRTSLSGDTTINTVLPVTPPRDAGIRVTVEEASSMIGGRPVQGGRRNGVIFPDLFFVNRVQGYTLYPGLRTPIGRDAALITRAGFGFSDKRFIGSMRLEGPLRSAAWYVAATRLMEDVGDVRQFDTPLDLLYPLASGRDPADWTLISRGMVGLRLPLDQYQVDIDAGMERSESVVTELTSRSFDRINPALGAGTATVGRLSIGRRWANQNEVVLKGEVGRGDANWQRFAGNVRLHQGIGPGRAILSLSGGIGSSELPGYRHFVLGGPATLAGVSTHSVGGRSMGLADLSYERRVSIMRLLGLSNSRGRPLGANTMAPFVAAGIAGGDDPALPWRAVNEVVAAAGVRFNIGGVSLPFGLKVP